MAHGAEFIPIDPSLFIPNDKEPYIHPLADVHETAIIGGGTKVWHQAQIGPNAEVGVNCVIGKGVYVDGGVIIGDGSKLQNGVNVYHGVDVGRAVFLGPRVTTTNDFYPRADNPDWEVTETVIENGASVGAGAVLVCGHRIGQRALVGAGAVVTREVLPYTLVAGNPARRIGWVNELGEPISNQPNRLPEELIPILGSFALLDRVREALEQKVQ